MSGGEFTFMWPSVHLGQGTGGVMDSEAPHTNPSRYCGLNTLPDGGITHCDAEVIIEWWIYVGSDNKLVQYFGN